ncbi:MAG: hypothetical protein HS132_12260 [Planctomycetia bacterium]|nr:hypothetical protein [Planctomycetia bacterium]
MELFRKFRLPSYKLIKLLPESVWLNSVGGMENGAIALGDWLKVYEEHMPGHINQIEAKKGRY